MVLPIKKLLKTTALFGIAALSFNTQADDDDIYWLNKWDDSCYQNGVNTCREEWYTTTQGSHLLMWEVFQTVEAANSRQLFAGLSNLKKFGFLYPEQTSLFDLYYKNDDDDEYGDGGYEPVESYLSVEGMPLGVLRDKSQVDNRNYLGFTCAACHTGEVTLGDDHYYVEAGQSFLDITAFFENLVAALEANKKGFKGLRFRLRFAAYVIFNKDATAEYVNPFAADAYLDEAITAVKGFFERNTNAVANGPARLDAIGSILNQVVIHQSGLDENGEGEVKPLTAPVSYPYIWDAASLECIQTNCISNNPLTRNIGQVLGVFGSVNLDDDESIPDLEELFMKEQGLNNLFETTAKVDNLYRIEKSLSYINSPKWPESFPDLDEDLMAEGKAVYDSACASCHVDVSDGLDDSELTAVNAAGYQFIKVAQVPFTEVGTDPTFVLDYGLRNEPTGLLGTVLQVIAPDTVDPATGIPFGIQAPEYFNALALLGAATGVIVQDHFESESFIAQAMQAFPTLPVELAVQSLIVEYSAGQIDSRPFNPVVYRGKPLNGIAFTGPYLHNGSVRTLADLLETPENRPSSFYVGSTEMDVDGVGYKDEGDFVLDTTIRGNSKEGHLYGTDLSDDEKRALLEYLKSI